MEPTFRKSISPCPIIQKSKSMIQKTIFQESGSATHQFQIQTQHYPNFALIPKHYSGDPPITPAAFLWKTIHQSSKTSSSWWWTILHPSSSPTSQSKSSIGLLTITVEYAHEKYLLCRSFQASPIITIVNAIDDIPSQKKSPSSSSHHLTIRLSSFQQEQLSTPTSSLFKTPAARKRKFVVKKFI